MAEVYLAEAVHDENNKYKNGAAGDQTGGEVRIRAWYQRPWNYCMRLKSKEMAFRLAYAMKSAANNKYIGYDQNQRNTILTYARKFKYDISKITTPCECDCSSLVSVALMFAGLKEEFFYKGGNCSTTKNLRARLTGTGYVNIYTTNRYTVSDSALEVGDILLYEDHHVAVVVDVNRKISPVQNKKTNIEIAKEIIKGEWGTGSDRKKAIIQAGYDYGEIQKEVNRLMNALKEAKTEEVKTE